MSLTAKMWPKAFTWKHVLWLFSTIQVSELAHGQQIRQSDHFDRGFPNKAKYDVWRHLSTLWQKTKAGGMQAVHVHHQS